jgi:hypothetical protein
MEFETPLAALSAVWSARIPTRKDGSKTHQGVTPEVTRWRFSKRSGLGFLAKRLIPLVAGAGIEPATYGL